MDEITVDVPDLSQAETINNFVSLFNNVLQQVTGEQVPVYVKGVTEEGSKTLDDVNNEIIETVLRDGDGKNTKQFRKIETKGLHTTFKAKTEIELGKYYQFDFYLPNIPKIFDGFGSLEIKLSGLPYETIPVLQKERYIFTKKRTISVSITGVRTAEVEFIYNYYGNGDVSDVTAYVVYKEETQ